MDSVLAPALLVTPVLSPVSSRNSQHFNLQTDSRCPHCCYAVFHILINFYRSHDRLFTTLVRMKGFFCCFMPLLRALACLSYLSPSPPGAGACAVTLHVEQPDTGLALQPGILKVHSILKSAQRIVQRTQQVTAQHEEHGLLSGWKLHSQNHTALPQEIQSPARAEPCTPDRGATWQESGPAAHLGCQMSGAEASSAVLRSAHSDWLLLTGVK